MTQQVVPHRLAVARSSVRPAIPGLVLLVALSIGALLRLVELGRPFPSSDQAEVAAIVALFYPTDLANALPSSPRSPWHLLINPHGVVQIMIAFVSITITGLAGLPVNEWWWDAPFALLNLLAIPLSYRLGCLLSGRVAGGLAALLIAILPLHVALSRTSGISHIPLAALVQLWLLTTAIPYFQSPTASSRGRFVRALTCAVITDLLLPLLFPTLLAVATLAITPHRPTWSARFKQARAVLFDPRVMRWPVIALTWPISLFLLRSFGVTEAGGLLSRLFEGSSHQPRLLIADFWQNALFVAGPISWLLLLGSAVAMLPSWLRKERRAIPLVWALSYFVPFVCFGRANVYGYFLLGLVPLTINAAIIIAMAVEHRSVLRRFSGGVVGLALVGLLLLRTQSMVWGGDYSALVGRGQAQGAVVQDGGLKAAAAWIRDHSTPDALIFGDPAYEPYQLFYYLHRPFIGMTDAPTTADGYALLNEADQVQFFLVRPGNEALLARHLQPTPQRTLVITEDNTPVLYVYSYDPTTTEVLTTAQGNQRFDRRYSTWSSVFGLDSPTESATH